VRDAVRCEELRERRVRVGRGGELADGLVVAEMRGADREALGGRGRGAGHGGRREDCGVACVR
jgi:hypothetical protein